MDELLFSFVNLFDPYEELAKVYALSKLYPKLYDTKLSIQRDLDELTILNPFIILLIITQNNHNFILNQFK